MGKKEQILVRKRQIQNKRGKRTSYLQHVFGSWETNKSTVKLDKK